MKYAFAFISLLLCSLFSHGQIGVDNTDPDPSSVLDLSATDKGLLIPRMTTTQREAIASPANSLLVYDTSFGSYFYYRDGQWVQVNSPWRGTSGSSIYYSSGNIGIGTATPNAPLQFANAGANRKIVLYEDANNDHQFYGFGFGASGSVRYQVASNLSNGHIWYAGTSSTTSNELMRLTGDGRLGIGQSPNTGRWLDVSGNANTGVRVNTTNAGSTPFIEFTVNNSLSAQQYYQIYKHTDNSLRFYNGSDRFTFSAAGNLGIGFAPNATERLVIKSAAVSSHGVGLVRSGGNNIIASLRENSSGNGELYLYNAAGTLYAYISNGIGTATDWVATSDRRLKENVKPVNGQLDKVRAISHYVVNYDRKDTGKNETGFIAQDLSRVAPEYVNIPDDPKEMQSVNYAKMVVPLYKGTAELSDEVQRLRIELSEEVERSKTAAEEIERLKNEIEELKRLLK